MEYMVAKAIKGQEYLYSRKTCHSVPARSRNIICDALNKAKYQLKAGEVWHVYEVDWYTRDLVNGKFYRRKGHLYEQNRAENKNGYVIQYTRR